MALKQRLFFIALVVLLMASAIYIIDISLIEDTESADLSVKPLDKQPSIPVEEGVFERSSMALKYKDMPENEDARSIEEYYDNRAYYGGPPKIPHPLLVAQGIGGEGCLQCHENGGFVKQFEAYAPVTPHPEKIYCRQCHVPQETTKAFKASTFEKAPPPPSKVKALQSSPPLIPHTLQMRNNCLACHAGPATPKAIKVTHPERINCRQCHAQVPLFSKEVEGWTRNSNDTDK